MPLDSPEDEGQLEVWLRNGLADSPMLIAVPAFRRVEKALNSSSLGGLCGAPIAKPQAEKVLSSLASKICQRPPLLSTLSQCVLNAASESMSDMAGLRVTK